MAVRERVAAVTGAASGIGRATALGLSRQGARVALCDLNTSGLAGVAITIQGAGGQVRVVELDVSNQEQATRAMDSIVQAWGRLDVLVNAAGIASAGQTSRGPVLNISEPDWDRIMDVNLLGTVYCAQAAARHMMRQRSGRIVNIASIAGAIPRLNAAAYGVSKAGVRMFTKCLALELARYGVTVNAVAPGPTDTPMLERDREGDEDAQMRERFIAGMPELFRLGVPLGKLGQAVAVMVAAVRQTYGAIHILVNNAGIALPSMSIVEVDAATWQRVL